ncbi:class I SAM-dependent methyltransferase [Flavobacterium sp. N2038]|uniref:class I SAM-dependent methyltransferase n=1 Tax=Flavobacterium sp. N2038 TaxID=2986829 RepID=UPI00222541CE|nr:class I SAM-dependent methyltransferase [Flavobacterium sp. N2038]
MKENNQKESFLAYEANAWFDRNRAIIKKYDSNKDRVITLIDEYNLNPKKVLEIGSSAGYRINALKSRYKECEVYGIDPSEKAIEYGRRHFSDVNFIHGTADNLESLENHSIDIVIVGFVFYVIDRDILFKVISEIDRVLKNGGILIIVDFFSEKSLKNVYEHINEFTAFSFKQNYEEIFTSSKLYYLLDKSTWNHTEKVLDATDNYYDKYSISLLKKDTVASYR